MPCPPPHRVWPESQVPRDFPWARSFPGRTPGIPGLALILALLWPQPWTQGAQTPAGKAVGHPPSEVATSTQSNPADPLGVAREIWIGLRQDDQDGDGTLGNPYNGTGPRLDALLRALSVQRAETNLAIHLLPGVFETRGLPQWHPLSGWKIHGAGMDVTTLKLVGASNNVYAVIFTATQDTENVEIADLTVDCNYSPTNPNYASAIVLAGSHHAIRRVKAIHAFGLEPFENFTLAITIGHQLLSEGNVIEDCEVSQFAGYYCTAISMGGGPEVFNSKYIQGTVRHNKVLDLHNPWGRSTGIAFGSGALRDFLFEGNLAARCDIAFNADTGRCRNLIFRGNRFVACQTRGLSLVGRELDNVVIEDNFIEMDPRSRDWALLCFDAGGLSKLTGFKIRDNIIRTANDLFSPAGGLFVSVTDGTSFLVTGNRVDARLQNYFSGSDLLLFDNTDFEGNPLRAPTAPGPAIQVPRGVGRGGTLLLDRGGAYQIVKAGDDPAANGQALLAAYGEAAALRPGGLPPSADNRVTVLITPGRYELPDGALQLTAPYVDLVGMGHPEGTRLESDGNTLVQLADHVRIENLTLHCRSTLSAAGNDQDKAAYFPLSNLPHAVLRRCILSASHQGWSMRLGITYAGQYEACTSGPRSFGGPGLFSGQASQCHAGDFSFGFGLGFTGFATNCAAGLSSFGAGSLGPASGFHGLAKGCQAGDGSFGGSGWMLDCDVAGGLNADSLTTGRLENCRIGPAPGNHPAVLIGPGATLYNCTLIANPAGTGFSIDAPQPVPARVAHCRMNHGMRNVQNAIEQPSNVDDPDLD